MLLDTGTLMQALGLRTGDPQTVAYYDLLRRLSERAIVSYVKWPILGQSGWIDYYDGTASENLILRWPYTVAVGAVNIDNNGAGGQANSAFSGANLTPGSDYMVRFDDGGQTKTPGNVSKSARLVMLNNSLFWFPSDFIWFRSSGGLGYRQPAVWPAGYGNIKVTSDWGFVNGLAVTTRAFGTGTVTFTTASNHRLYGGQTVTISGCVPTGWNGDYQVLSCPTATTFTVAAASDQGAITTNGSLNSVPQDIQLALVTSVGQLRSTVKYGGAITSENGGKYNASVNLSMDPAYGTVRQLLGPYRNVSISGFA